MARAGAPLALRAAAAGIAVLPYSLGRLAVAGRSFDLVHAHDGRGHTAAAVAGFGRLIVSRRVAFPVRGGVLSRWKYRRPVLFLAVSEFVAGRLRAHGVPAERIRVVYDAVPLAPMAAGERGGVVAPASEDPMKGSALVRAAGIEVKFSTDLAEDLKSAKVMIYLTHEEGLGSAILLAMMSGAAVVASDVGGIPELIRHEETGLLTANEPGAVRAAVGRLLEEPGLAARLAAEARRMVEARFTAEAMTRATMAAYKEVLG